MGCRRPVVLVAVLALAATALAGCELFPGSPDFIVTTTVDGADADPGDGICEVTVGSEDCSLRAAITEANASTVVSSVTVPTGTYALTLPGTDDTNGAGDLDLSPAAGSMVLVSDSPSGFAVDATGADGGIDLHSGNLAAFGVGISGATGDGVNIRGNALGAFTFSSIHDNGGAGVRVGLGARAQLWTTTISGNGAGGVANQGRTTTKFVTVANNAGGGFTGRGDDGPNNGIVLDSSIVAQQASGLNCADGALSSTYTVMSADGTCAYGTGSYQATVPVVEPLTGGLLPYHPLVYPGAGYGRDDVPLGSGSCIAGSALMVDQRGVVRPVGGACDRGAYEGPEPLSITVDSNNDQPDADPGDGVCETATLACTLRAAIDESNASPGVDTITVGATVFPTLTLDGSDEDQNATGDLDVTDAVAIVGHGSTVHSAVADRLFDLHGEVFTSRISDLVLSGGDASADVRGGGAIWTDGGLALERVTIDGTKGSTYGAIESVAVHPRSLTLTDVRVTGTTGSVAAVRAELATIERTTIDSSVGSGGLSMYAGRITDSSLLDNGGSGLRVTSPAAGSPESDLDVFRSTIAGNVATDAGGGIHVFPGIGVFLNDSTVSGNTAPVGAAIFTEPVGTSGLWNGSASVLSSTVSANVGATSLAGSIGLGSSAVDGGSGVACGGPAGSWPNGRTVVTDGSCALPAGENPVVADLGLGPLADNGGPTLTHLPEPGSPVVDIVVPDAGIGRCTGPVTDQRGVFRPQGLACDAGSVESEYVVGGDLIVDTALDAVDAAPGDGVCATGAGDCSLRAAVEESNRSTEVETIGFEAGIDPILSIAGRNEDVNATGDLDITQQVTIQGAGTTIDGAGIDRILDTRSVVGIVNLLGLTLRGGDGSAGPGSGPGAIASAGGLRLTDVAVVDNVGAGVGAIGVTSANILDENHRLVLTDTEVARNRGGPAVSVAGGQVTLDGAEVQDNAGGGVVVNGQSVEVRRSIFRGNVGGDGAGLRVAGTTSLGVDRSWFDGNTSAGNGGGLAADVALSVTASTFSDNTAVSGGGIYAGGELTAMNSTFSGNSSTSGGSAIQTASGASVLLSTLAGNHGPRSLSSPTATLVLSIVAPATGLACTTPAAVLDHSLVSDTSCGSGGTTVIGSPNLGPLQDNGGDTPTRLLQPGSPGRNAVSTSATLTTPFGPMPWACPFLLTNIDQRGVSRPQSGSCDIGATEQ
jgi:CSLREA domain-containing protein